MTKYSIEFDLKNGQSFGNDSVSLWTVIRSLIAFIRYQEEPKAITIWKNKE